MTTDNLGGIKATREAARMLATEVLERDQRLAEELRDFERERERLEAEARETAMAFELAARASAQAYDDARRDLDEQCAPHVEERGQLRGILTGASQSVSTPAEPDVPWFTQPPRSATPSAAAEPIPPEPPAPSPTHPAIRTEEELNELPLDELVALAQGWGVIYHASNFEAVDQSVRESMIPWILWAQTQWIRSYGPDDEGPGQTPTEPQPVVRRWRQWFTRRFTWVRESRYYPLNWCLECWIAAFIGAIIGFIVGFTNHEAVTDEVKGWKWVPGTIWVGGFTVIGFCFAGLLCTWWCERRRQRSASGGED